MEWSDLPPLNSLRAFAAIAEAGSVSRAGAALNVSHAAISQQLRALEARLGVALVAREGRGVALTRDGAVLAHHLALGFGAIHNGVEAVTGFAAKRPVQVTMSPAFAVSWLMPRLNGFRQAHPDVELMLNPTADVMELTPGGIDVAIRFCDGSWPGVEITPFLLPALVVVGTPALIGSRDIADPATFTELPWLQELGTNEVSEWLARRGIEPERPVEIVHMPGNLIMEAVRRGDGLTYTPRIFVEDEIRTGQLVELFSEHDTGGFYIATRPGVLRPPVRSFVTWLKRQATAEAGALRTHGAWKAS
ncbi:MAG: LysR family transcriptional regulator [Paracoccaceae bacterium]